MKLLKLLMTIVLLVAMFIPMYARSGDQALLQIAAQLEEGVEITNPDKRTEFVFITNFGTGDQVLYPAVAERIFTLTKEAADSTLTLDVTNYTFANDTSDVNYMVFGDAVVSWPDTVTVYKPIYMNATLYYIGCAEDSGDLSFTFYNSSYAKVAVPTIYGLSVGIAFFDNP